VTVTFKVAPGGRLTNAIAGKRMRGALGLPKGVGYCVPVPRDLLTSCAWLAMTDQCRKLIDALMVEHANHGGVENGSLVAPYDTLQSRGMRRSSILAAVMEAGALGLVDPTRGIRSFGSRKIPSTYRLTWLGTPDGLPPTNEWKSIKTDDEAVVRVRNAMERLKRERSIKAATRAEYAAHPNLRRAS
jgi:hypothetical protein